MSEAGPGGKSKPAEAGDFERSNELVRVSNRVKTHQ